jgi:hypothetical protein
MQSMLILGLNAFHGDSAACLVRDGRLVAAAEHDGDFATLIQPTATDQ